MKYFVFVILLFVFSSLQGRNTNEDFICFNTSNGKLMHNTVDAIARDKQGYIWVGTNYGLNRLDGYQTVNYLNDPTDSTTLTSNFINALYVDSSNDLWIGTIGGGLNKYDRKSNSFIHISPSDSNISGINISAFTEDKSGNIWIGTIGEGVNKYDKKTGLFKKFDLAKADPYHRINSNVVKLLCDYQGNIWVGLNQGEVFMINTKTETISYHSLLKSQSGFNEIGSIKGIAQQKNGILLFATWTGNLYKLDPKADNQIQLLRGPQYFDNNYLTDITIDTDDNIWIGTWENGIFKIEAGKDILISIRRNRFSLNSLGSNAINIFYIDIHNNLWIGTIDNGLSLLPLQKKMFRKLNIDDPGSPVPIEMNAYSIVRDRNDNLWVGTRGQGIWQYDLRTGQTSNYQIGNCEGLLSNSILTLELNKEGNIWVGTDGGFISLLNPLTKKFIKLDNKNDDWSQAIFAIAESEDYLWGGTWGGGIKKVDKKTLKYTSINFDEKDQFRNSVFDLELCDSILWVANIGIGLIRFNINNESKTIYTHSNKYPDFPKERIIDIHLENPNSLFISTDGAGLFQFIPSEEKVIKIGTNNSLASNVVQSTITDDNGNLWIATISGVSHVDRTTGKIYNFYKHNGLSNNQLNKGALFYDMIGHIIYTGGVEGVNYSDPSQIITDTLVKKVIITGLQISGKSILKPNNRNISESVDLAKEISLYRKDRMITVYFSSMDFNPSSRNRYFFKLSGFDKDWTEIDYSKNFAQYTNLYPGEYIFKVKSCNRDGLLSEVETGIKIKMHPAFWQTIIFKVIVSLIIMNLIVLYFRNKYKSLLRTKVLLEKKVHERTSEIEKQKEHIEKQKRDLEMANNTKNKFFSIISHDLRNPVTSIDQLAKLILMQYDVTSDDKIKLYLNSLEKSSSNTLELLNDLLVWAQTQTNRIKIKKIHIPIDELMISIESYCDDIAQKKNIELDLPYQTNLKVNADKNTIQTVLRNLVTNAIKFSHPDGKVEVKVESKGYKVIFKIIDHGIGMKESEMQNLFKIESLFSKPGTSGETGTGLGLIICSEFLTLNGAKIHVESESGKGTTFWFSIEKVR